MQLGKSVRLSRIINRHTKRTIIVPMDHGVTAGLIKGLAEMESTVNNVSEAGANALLMHKGLAYRLHAAKKPGTGLIIHLSASTQHSPTPNSKTLVGGVKEAVRLGADAVSVHVNIGDEKEGEMLGALGRITATASEWGMPVLAMIYGRGPKISNGFDPGIVAHCARIGEELGADIVKVNYTGDVESFKSVVKACAIPVVIAGGPRMESRKDILRMVHDSLLAGGAGLSIGRNIFQDEQPGALVQALHFLAQENGNMEQALEHLKKMKISSIIKKNSSKESMTAS